MTEQIRDPEEFFARLMKKGGRPQKLKNLEKLQELCRNQAAAGSRDFSRANLSKLLDEHKIFAGRSLYNSQAADYCSLIDCWQLHAGPPPLKVPSATVTEQYIERISDPAIRALVTSLSVERRKLRTELDILKSEKTFIVDRRPPKLADSSTVMQAGISLTDSERQAVKKAISQDFLERQGWREVELGEIVNKMGRPVFDPGYATALRKLLGVPEAD